jgi:hypothetical protein
MIALKIKTACESKIPLVQLVTNGGNISRELSARSLHYPVLEK